MRINLIHSKDENLEIEYISAALKAEGHIVNLSFHAMLFNDDYLDIPFLAALFDNIDRFILNILDDAPDMVYFSIYNNDWRWIKKVVSGLKRRQPGLIVVAQCDNRCAEPTEIMKFREIDFLCTSANACAPIIELTDALERGLEPVGIQNMVFRAGDRLIISDSDSSGSSESILSLQLSYPDKDLFYDVAPYFKRYYLASAMNCNNRIQAENEAEPQRRSVHMVISEIERAVRLWKSRLIIFNDPHFLCDPEWIFQFCKELKTRISIPWTCSEPGIGCNHPSAATDRKLRKLMHASGFRPLCCSETPVGGDIRHYILIRKYLYNLFRGCFRAIWQ